MVLAIMASMDFPLSLDALIAEAKRRMMRRRLVIAITALAVVATGLTLGLRPSGSSPVHRATGAGDSSNALAGVLPSGHRPRIDDLRVGRRRKCRLRGRRTGASGLQPRRELGIYASALPGQLMEVN